MLHGAPDPDTWALLAGELGAEPPVRYEQRIYEATALSLLHLLREAGGENQTVLSSGTTPESRSSPWGSRR